MIYGEFHTLDNFNTRLFRKKESDPIKELGNTVQIITTDTF